jgi:hypothetical protein
MQEIRKSFHDTHPTRSRVGARWYRVSHDGCDIHRIEVAVSLPRKSEHAPARWTWRLLLNGDTYEKVSSLFREKYESERRETATGKALVEFWNDLRNRLNAADPGAEMVAEQEE